MVISFRLTIIRVTISIVKILKRYLKANMILICRESRDERTLSGRGLCILVSGGAASAMVLESKFGQMVPSTVVSGEKTELMAKADLSMWMAPCMMASGLMIWQMVLANINRSMEASMTVCGVKICSTATALKLGWILHGMKEITPRGASMASAASNGTTALSIRATGSRTRYLG